MAFGTYTVVLSYDTGSGLGVLTSKRMVKVEIPVFEAQSAAYEAAKKANNAAKMADASRKLLAKWPNRKVKAGEACDFGNVRLGEKPGPDKLQATVCWRPGKDAIVADIEVVDAFFSINQEQPHLGSSVSVYFAPSGFDDSRVYYTITPSGPEDAPPVITMEGGGPMAARWQRTETGYHVTATVPYTSLKGVQNDWQCMPVDAMVNSKTPNGRCSLIVGIRGVPWQGSQFYCAVAR